MAPKPILRRVGIVLLCFVVIQLLMERFYPSDQLSNTPQSILLKVPSFVSIAKAEDAATIGDEAGISAWYEASSPINLATVRNQFRTVERETSDYIVGSVSVASYDESEDIHLYIHKDGKVLAYYLAAEPSGKIFDWQAYKSSGGSAITTKLENTIGAILNGLGIQFNGATYYDFRYPNATHMMIIAENNENKDESFTVNLPSSFVYSERSWFIANYSSIYLNSTRIEFASGEENKQGTFLATQLTPNVSHAIRVNGGFGGLILTYREQ